jgi:hypothetical protein
MSNKWRCVDAKIEGLYVHGGESLTPRDLMEWAQEKVYLHKFGNKSQENGEEE